MLCRSNIDVAIKQHLDRGNRLLPVFLTLAHGVLFDASMKTHHHIFGLIICLSLAFATTGCITPTTFRQEYGRSIGPTDSEASIPTGMRRTKNGWEDASTWVWENGRSPTSINGWIEEQQDREPSWVRKVFDRIRSTPPLMVGVIQIASIAAITAIAKSARKVSAPSSDREEK
ncbi:hypothetical protein CGZ80_16730 [Rhodopirellula sp. MGV]|nr:hypothetical protein CGZ80_16730 [Rhodopirellula sp. MGV]PNY38318.1 hypothetical protein C2E31_03115 [Rhodopirellula baltica]